MTTITKNCLTTIALKIEDENAKLLDESDAVIYLHGSYGQIFQKIEDELEGKAVGDSFKVLLSPEEAFGAYDEALVLKESLDELPEDIALGMELDGEDESVVWIVEAIEDGYATLNANHELAGIALWISGEILDIEPLSDEGVQEILNMEDDH